MSRSTKIGLIAVITASIIGSMILCCVLIVGTGFFFKQNYITDPKQATTIANQISDFELPAGYHIKSAIPTFGSATAFMGDKTGKTAIWLTQVTIGNGVPPDRYLRQSISFITYKDVTWEEVDTKQVSIRGEQTTLTVYTGTGPNNQKYHAWAGNFKGKGGKAILVIVEPEESWDEDAMLAFVASMH